MDEKIQKIVAALEEDIEDRSGLGNEWEVIDDEVKDEIRAKWIDLIRKILAA